ncbi:3-phosphoshikimate 1-carboxyvinyltransferase [Staphylococcus gallinarum]|uniref:3-phosphoshikimate 1-carboxyvinyltransferase n=1 Tax=Staphylococcus gallinarum TaxID=1293 RepID=A0A380FIF1_STAGA|nr:3-phosphoshikimate 1-carboxyvinyltransferase [Staphylococcus gallinarum]
MTNNETIAINGPLTGEIEVPGDKSMTHRAIMLASLATGKSTINKPLLGEDCLRTVEIFKKLGVDISVSDNKIEIDSPGYKHFKNTAPSVIYRKFRNDNTISCWTIMWFRN